MEMFLAGEVPIAPISMAVALLVAFLGCIGLGIYVVSHAREVFHASEPPEAGVEGVG